MESKKVLLTLNKGLYELLKQKADQNYMSVQELIYDVLRRNVLPTKKTGAGRPKKVEDQYIEYFSRKR
ncbi:hypothetical protein HY489_02975 [Candidatus Woesearchaeota archaeon]|nr:hypothetical protein [Candidatus Woesearchaeota archaeon]